MKKIISLVLSTILLFSVINTTAFAISPSSETEVTENIIQYEDGYYAVIEYDEVKAVSTMSTVSLISVPCDTSFAKRITSVFLSETLLTRGDTTKVTATARMIQTIPIAVLFFIVWFPL